jgi:hypothetical protein
MVEIALCHPVLGGDLVEPAIESGLLIRSELVVSERGPGVAAPDGVFAQGGDEAPGNLPVADGLCSGPSVIFDTQKLERHASE